MQYITNEQISKWIPKRKSNIYKNKLGRILCIGGNEQMGGAIILSAKASLYAGAGLVTVASSPNNLHALHAHVPESMFLNMYDTKALKKSIKSSDVVVLGPGLGRDKVAYNIFKTTLNTINEKQWLVLDADALYHLSENISNLKISTKNIVLTPHLGEWKTLTNIRPPADNIKLNQKYANKLNATVVLKKERTEIYMDKGIWKNTAGNPGMATGGMGDTLTGIIASCIGQFENKVEGILSAVYIHSAAADELAKTQHITLPTRIIDYLPIYIKNLMN